jgi:hypothetical protein
MRLGAVERYRSPATDVVMWGLKDDGGGYIGDPGRFYRELGKHLAIDTRLLASAVDRLFWAAKIMKVYGGPGHRYVVGICLPGYNFNSSETKDLGRLRYSHI